MLKNEKVFIDGVRANRFYQQMDKTGAWVGFFDTGDLGLLTAIVEIKCEPYTMILYRKLSPVAIVEYIKNDYLIETYHWGWQLCTKTEDKRRNKISFDLHPLNEHLISLTPRLKGRIDDVE